MRLLTILYLVLLSPYSYSQQVIPEIETVTRDGLIYNQDTNEPVTGIVESFRDNGQLESRGNFKDGEYDGLYEEFYTNGQLSSRENWIDGKRDGLEENFGQNGQLFRRSNYIDGLQDGVHDFFDEDGNLTQTRTFRNGVLVE